MLPTAIPDAEILMVRFCRSFLMCFDWTVHPTPIVARGVVLAKYLDPYSSLSLPFTVPSPLPSHPLILASLEHYKNIVKHSVNSRKIIVPINYQNRRKMISITFYKSKIIKLCRPTPALLSEKNGPNYTHFTVPSSVSNQIIPCKCNISFI